ncbi:phage tail protein [Pseudomonas sp. HY13-MNA-CIBAN-0226]|uniref:phage tail protein n=1 Tax=Pseudomonas sp. HY13-MNA-CIBAN-0226 TaxID=3140473 RepID=UPI003319BC2E
MVDKNTIFGGLLTTAGVAKKTNCDALGVPWQPKFMLIGDAAGGDPVPDPAQTKLINQVYRAQLNQLYVSPTDDKVLIAELVLPPDVGGWWIRELALEDSDGVFSAVANAAPSYKPLLSQGSGRNQVVRMHIIINSTANIELKIDPSVVLATRAYVDLKVMEELNKQNSKHSVRAATTGNIDLIGTQTIDGVAVKVGARVLVKDQKLGSQNGLYRCAAGAWSRTDDAKTWSALVSAYVFVEQGEQNADTGWLFTVDSGGSLGTTAVTAMQFAGAGIVTAGDGIELVGNQVALAQSGVVAGTYPKVTVDRFGRVTEGAGLAAQDIPSLDWGKIASGLPSTLGGYGITDSYTQAQAQGLVNNALSNFSAPNIQVPALINGFADANSSRYWKANGNVYVSLDISRWVSNGVAAIVIFTLPPGFRPRLRVCGVGDWATQSPFGLGWLSWRVETNGDVILDYSTGSTSGASGYACQLSFCTQVE